LKVALAAMSCYSSTRRWIGRAFAPRLSPVVSSPSKAPKQRCAKRDCGSSAAAIGGLARFLSIMYLVPRMESIVSLVLLTAAGTALAGWVAAGSQRIAYAGLQIALAFFMCIFQGFAPDTDFNTIRNRSVGIVLGIVVIPSSFNTSGRARILFLPIEFSAADNPKELSPCSPSRGIHAA
jgi:multidrug resistance protein MdtO